MGWKTFQFLLNTSSLDTIMVYISSLLHIVLDIYLFFSHFFKFKKHFKIVSIIKINMTALGQIKMV